MSKGGVADHPLRLQLSQLYKGLKMHDLDGDGHLAPTDIVRGLAAFNLAVGDPKKTAIVNELMMRNMTSNGLVNYRTFVYSLAANEALTSSIMNNQSAKGILDKARTQSAMAGKPMGPKGPSVREGVTSEELRRAQSTIKAKMLEHYSGVAQAFRAMDKDGSGNISRTEFQLMLRNFNIPNIRPAVLDTIIDFIDLDKRVAEDDDEDSGTTRIAFGEFCRFFANDEDITITKMPLASKKPMFAPTPPPTPPPQNLGASAVSQVVLTKFKPDQMRQAFGFLDLDSSQKLTRAEMKRALTMWNMLLTDDELIDLFDACDTSRDGLIDYQEFVDMVARNPSMTTTRPLVKNATLRPGVKANDLRRAQLQIRDTLLRKYSSYTNVFKYLDKDRTGSITRAELKQALTDLNLNQINGTILDNLIDFINVDPQWSDIEYKELVRVLSAEDVMDMAPLSLAPAERQQATSNGLHDMSLMPHFGEGI